MKTAFFSGAVLAFALTAVSAAAAQNKPMVAAKILVGCIEKSESGSLMLTGAMPAGDMKKPSMAKDSMAKDMMMPAVELSSKKVDLSKHVGHRVSLKGASGDMMNGMATFTVDSVKMIAASCSQ